MVVVDRCIGGMGAFILTAAVGVSTGIAWDWTLENMSMQFLNLKSFLKVLCAFGLCAGLSVVQYFCR